MVVVSTLSQLGIWTGIWTVEIPWPDHIMKFIVPVLPAFLSTPLVVPDSHAFLKRTVKFVHGPGSRKIKSYRGPP